MSLFKKKENKKDGLLFVASVMPAFSGMFCDLLSQENIPFICREQRTGGYLKIVTGALLVPDDFYVNEKDYARAKEIYESFIIPTDELEQEEI